MRRFVGAIIVVGVLLLVGCGRNVEAIDNTDSNAASNAVSNTDSNADSNAVTNIEESPAVLTDVVPKEPVEVLEDNITEAPERLSDEELRALNVYECGEIMVLMYHGITEGEPPSRYQRQKDDFYGDLDALYSRGFRLISLRDVIDNNITTPAGFSPVVITFDDGIDTSFSLIDGENGFELSPDCGLAIMRRFSAEHPDFGCTATLFINGNVDTFAGAGTIAQRLRWLVDNGFDIGNHTYSHPELNSLNADEIQKEIGLVDQLIKSSVPGYEPFALAYPKGIRPVDELKPLAINGVYGGEQYSYAVALREGMSGAPSVTYRAGFDPLNYPRVRGSATEDEPTDLWGRLRYYDEHSEYRFISDGDPAVITCPKDYTGNVDITLIGDKEVRVYD